MITAVLIGAGDRGRIAYGSWVLRNPGRLNFVAVAEPNEIRRKKFSEEHKIVPENCFVTWEDLLKKKKMADVCFVTTQDQMHTDPVIKALEKGYHVMVEKPMATSPEECFKIIETSAKMKKHLWIAHVLRYTPFYSCIKKIVTEGHIGDIINIKHSENISYWHFSHSYVRGNWSREEEASPIILAKTCHDMDILYWLSDSPAKKISSFGSLKFYREENSPEGVPSRCLEGCPEAESCQWYAPRIYVKAEPLLQIGLRASAIYKKLLAKSALEFPSIVKALSKLYAPLDTLINWSVWPVSVITDDFSRESVEQALKEGPYGRCVFKCDNNVCDNQVVSLEFDNGITATLTVHGFASIEGRWTRIEGTKGTLLGKFTAESQEIIIYDHFNARRKIIMNEDLKLDGHAGGDDGLMKSLIATLENEIINGEKLTVLTSGDNSLESHLMAFAAEKSRKENRIVDLSELRINN